MELKEMKCNFCKVNLPIKKFSKNRAEKYLKSCDECRVKQKTAREKYKCPHKKQRYHCIECAGAGICEHDRMRSHCFDCKGSEICPHKRQRKQCFDCKGSQICHHDRQRSQCKHCSDSIKVTIKCWISDSRYADKKYNIYDPNNFIDKCFLEGLIEDYPKCKYCNINIQYVEFQDDLGTIERLDNKIGHIKSNCVLACKKCNNSRVGQKKDEKEEKEETN